MKEREKTMQRTVGRSRVKESEVAMVFGSSWQVLSNSVVDWMEKELRSREQIRRRELYAL